MITSKAASAEQEALLWAVGEVGRARTLDDFARRCCDCLLQLVPGVSSSYNELNLFSGRASAVVWPDPGAEWFARFGPPFARLMQQNPLLDYFETTGEAGPVCWGDVDPAAAFARTELFAEFYEPNGIVDQLAVTLPSPPGVVVGLAVNRDRPRFSAAERRLVALLRVYLVNVHRLVTEVEAARARTRTLTADGWTVVLVSDSGEVVGSNESAVAVGASAGLDLREGASLTGTSLWRHFTHAADRAECSVLTPPAPVALPGGQGAYEAVAVSTAVGPHVVWLREPSRVTLASAVKAGLTPRQAQVAVHLVDGATNQQIATGLRISPGTVRKHLEAIFRILNVGSRAAAVAALIGAARAQQ